MTGQKDGSTKSELARRLDIWKKVRNFKFVFGFYGLYKAARGIEKTSIFLIIGRRFFPPFFLSVL